MPYVENDGVKIYYETEGTGPPLLLHHGLMSSHIEFKTTGYTESLGKQYKLILMDARGHGKSDKPYKPESYQMKKMASDVIAVLDDLGVEKAHFFGYSYGGKIGLAILKYFPDRFMSFIIGGMGAIEPDSEEEIQRTQKQINGYGKGLEERVNGLISYGLSETDARAFVEGIDWKAMTALSSYTEHIGFDEYLPDLSNPCMLYAGTEDHFYQAAKETADLMVDVCFASLPGLDHFEAFIHKEEILPQIQRFIEKQL